MTQQTAVEFLLMRYHQWQGVLKDIDIEQAKKMEKEQIINAFIDGDFMSTGMDKDAEIYYKETYNK